ncbi:unnamed protein product [Rotaria magnacalcarata]
MLPPLESYLVRHILCATPDNRDLVNIGMIQNELPAVASILAGSSRKLSINHTVLEEIDFLIMFERNGTAMSSKEYFTHCFLDWDLQLSVHCEVIGFGIVQGILTLSYRYFMKREGRLVCPIEPLQVPTNLEHCCTIN